jgi:PAS domain S-box-containing protein
MGKKNKVINDVLLLSDRSIEYQWRLKDRALAATAEGITISDNLQTDNPIVYANFGFERLTGYNREDVLGKNCRFLQGPDSDPQVIKEISRAIHAEESCSVEILNYHKDGTPFWNQLSITPIRDETGRVTNFLGIQSDITKRKNFENALFRVSKDLEEANDRMRKELEEARELQRTMLPDSLPKLPHLEIATSMETAHEVGGDYYDFYVDEDQNLTLALGDATGHGLKAGTIVTATKALFNFFATYKDPREILTKISVTLKEMGFRNMYMAMLIAKISKNKMIVSSAGMPFIFYYSKAEQKVTEIELKGLPLGGFPDFTYQSKEINLKKGDTFLFLSDGLLELFSQAGEIFGEKRAKKLFQKIASQSPQKIIEQLNQAALEWTNQPDPSDDMTFVVIKVK